tara:strand:- start:14758 stop:15447 length:690 start_codon:yes stop_codon:yes gene_type:complete
MSIQKEYEGKTVTDATIEACKDLGVNREDLEFEVVSEGSTGLLGIGGRNAVIKVISAEVNDEESPMESPASLDPIDTAKVHEIFSEIVSYFVEDAKIDVETNERNIIMKLKSDSNLGFLIGKKGEMIKNIEFLLSRIASKQNSSSVFVSIDINSFREKKDKELVERVNVLIDKVVSINRPLSLNPMNSYERRICYLEIEKNTEVTYKTKEVGMLKKITVLPKVIDKNLS